MRSLLFVILSLGFTAALIAQSPHGKALKIDCAACHSAAGWGINAAQWKDFESETEAAGKKHFKHQETGFELKGEHVGIDCRGCHNALDFSKIGTGCISCHTDLHQQTVGTNCARCHNASNWLVDNITEIHQENGFPLLGVHAVTSCFDCHTSETALRFDRIGNACIDCHSADYAATTAPNHKAAGYSTNCEMCHDLAASEWLWTAGSANHLFFPLTKGHAINDCTRCHSGGNFTNTPSNCFACHEMDFRATSNPDHEVNNFTTDCTTCHSTDVGWPVTSYTQHDQAYFPIFSGKHDGAWNQCSECHTTSGNFNAFSCVDCHEHNNPGNLADHHSDVSGYSYTSTACYSCHPKGRK